MLGHPLSRLIKCSETMKLSALDTDTDTLFYATRKERKTNNNNNSNNNNNKDEENVFYPVCYVLPVRFFFFFFLLLLLSLPPLRFVFIRNGVGVQCLGSCPSYLPQPPSSLPPTTTPHPTPPFPRTSPVARCMLCNRR